MFHLNQDLYACRVRVAHGTVSELNAGIVLLRRCPLNELACLSLSLSLCMDIISGNINMSGDAFLRQKLYSYRNCGLKTSERVFKLIQETPPLTL